MMSRQRENQLPPSVSILLKFNPHTLQRLERKWERNREREKEWKREGKIGQRWKRAKLKDRKREKRKGQWERERKGDK